MKDAISSRRQFLRTASMGGAFAAAGALAHSAAAQSGEGPSNRAGLIDARVHGATGNGMTDDTAALTGAIRTAEDSGAGGVFLPGGIYRISDALRLPSNFRLVGAGRGLTTVQAAPDTLFPMFRPDPRTMDIRQRRSLITTTSAGATRQRIVEDVSIEDMTVDWNHCPTERFGHSVVLMDSVDRGILRNVCFVNCMPSDHPRSRGSDLTGSIFRCECVMYSNARDGLMDRCHLTDSGYRPLSVSYGSLRIIFRNGVIHAEKPVWRHAFSENHGDALPRDETFVHSQLFFLDSEFILDDGAPGDGICSHTGTTHVENCDFRIRGGVAALSWIIRAFDGSQVCSYINNRFHCDAQFERAFAMVGTSRRTNPERDDNQSIIVEGNHVHASFAEPDSERDIGLFHFPATDRRIRISGNQVLLHRSGAHHPPVIFAEGAGNVVVSGNSIETHAPDGRGPEIVRLVNCTGGAVYGNVALGAYRRGLLVEGPRDRIAVSGNFFRDAAENGVSPEE